MKKVRGETGVSMTGIHCSGSAARTTIHEYIRRIGLLQHDSQPHHYYR